MKQITRNLSLAALALLSMNSCIDETTPTGNYITDSQINGESTAALDGLTNGIVGMYSKFGNVYKGYEYVFDFGYSGMALVREVLGPDFTINETALDYHNDWANTNYLGDDYKTCYYPWLYYYKAIASANNIIRCSFSESNKMYFGLAHFFRAMDYMDAARMFEYKKTGVQALDEQAEANGLYGLTLPIIKETTTEEEARHLPRAPFTEMWQFIYDDLQKAQEYLEDYMRPADKKNYPDLAVVYGQKARFFLEMGSRFEQNADDLAKAQQYGMTICGDKELSAASCFEWAEQYAQWAINLSGASPLTEEQWYGGNDYSTGFNSIGSNKSWMLGAILTKESLSEYPWSNFIGSVAVEQSFGVGSYTGYQGQRLVSKQLFDNIVDGDWRKATWIAPEDAGTIPGTKYKTLLTDEQFADQPAYTSFKFRPAQGNMTDYLVGAVADFPMMRVEEMYLIEAEAVAHRNLENGCFKLNEFMNEYRMAPGSLFICQASTLDDFLVQLLYVKRAEFWGEGIVYFDFKRLNKAVERGYEGTNIPSAYRMNSNEGYCAPWMNIYIPKAEQGLDPAIKPNPNPSNAIPLWNN